MTAYNVGPAIRALTIKLESCVVSDYSAFFRDLDLAVDSLAAKYAVPTPAATAPTAPTALTPTTPPTSSSPATATPDPSSDAPDTPLTACGSQSDDVLETPNNPRDKCRLWIEAVLGETLDADLPQALKSGAVLCRLMNTINPGSVPKWSTSAMPFPQRENIKLFLDAAERMRVSSAERFETQDLFDGKKMDNVYICIMAVADASRRTGFKGPFLERPRAHRQR